MEETGRRRQGPGAGIGVGASSVLAVFVVLCLTTFAVLSLASARADLRLSQKAARQTALYYEADARGQLLLSRLGALTGDAGTLPVLAKELTYVTDSRATPQGRILVDFSIPVTDGQTLTGQADIAPLLSGGGVELLTYQVVAEDDAGADRIPDLWDGTFSSAPPG